MLLAISLLLAAEFYKLTLKILNLYSLEKWYRQAQQETQQGTQQGTQAGEEMPHRYAYQKALQKQALCQSVLQALVMLTFLALRLPAWLFTQLGGLLTAVGWFSPMLQGILFIAALQLAQFLLALPWGLYRRFVIEEHFGFNRMCPKDYAKDLLRSGILVLVLGLPLLGTLFWLIQNLEWWWLWGFLALAAYQILLLWLYPIFIAPLFNRFTPLADEGPQGQLKQRLESLLAQCQFAAKGLFVMDSSKRSRHSNAYFTGFGKSRRIVLFDNLLEALDHEPLAAVLAHEIGHYQNKHISKNLVQSLLCLLLSFGGLQLLSQWQWLFASFGFRAPPNPAVLFFVGMVLSSPLGLIAQRLTNHFSRKHEFEADAYAAQVLGDAQPLCQALETLYRDNLSNPAPHPSYAALYHSHPHLPERLAALQDQT